MEYKHGRGLIRINKSSISKPYNIKELFTRTHIEVKKEKKQQLEAAARGRVLAVAVGPVSSPVEAERPHMQRRVVTSVFVVPSHCALET